MLGNCCLYALRRWLREGGYLIFRRSYSGWWPHASWSADLRTFWQFRPPHPKAGMLLPPPLYRGEVSSFTSSADD